MWVEINRVILSAHLIEKTSTLDNVCKMRVFLHRAFRSTSPLAVNVMIRAMCIRSQINELLQFVLCYVRDVSNKICPNLSKSLSS